MPESVTTQPLFQGTSLSSSTSSPTDPQTVIAQQETALNMEPMEQSNYRNAYDSLSLQVHPSASLHGSTEDDLHSQMSLCYTNFTQRCKGYFRPTAQATDPQESAPYMQPIERSNYRNAFDSASLQVHPSASLHGSSTDDLHCHMLLCYTCFLQKCEGCFRSRPSPIPESVTTQPLFQGVSPTSPTDPQVVTALPIPESVTMQRLFEGISSTAATYSYMAKQETALNMEPIEQNTTAATCSHMAQQETALNTEPIEQNTTAATCPHTAQQETALNMEPIEQHTASLEDMSLEDRNALDSLSLKVHPSASLYDSSEDVYRTLPPMPQVYVRTDHQCTDRLRTAELRVYSGPSLTSPRHTGTRQASPVQSHTTAPVQESLEQIVVLSLHASPEHMVVPPLNTMPQSTTVSLIQASLVCQVEGSTTSSPTTSSSTTSSPTVIPSSSGTSSPTVIHVPLEKRANDLPSTTDPSKSEDGLPAQESMLTSQSRSQSPSVSKSVTCTSRPDSPNSLVQEAAHSRSPSPQASVHIIDTSPGHTPAPLRLPEHAADGGTMDEEPENRTETSGNEQGNG